MEYGGRWSPPPTYQGGALGVVEGDAVGVVVGGTAGLVAASAISVPLNQVESLREDCRGRRDKKIIRRICTLRNVW